ncbi:fungal zn binuclear cluster domain containing protein [Colletotrichum karsti]|uniref:Fungal zn binuclear cluster domain containing protein n=1 Tax=Colletotrichum karsti TaxID=1095194 RepID=A0A9P6LNB0_9PEZI|nr:fungal zn binuclear cluster domain containing protein [Colletotrichum karsti]KAF9879016.1 fungal zn binuclear cluster domain containing protein [Colletotrichum karsti]
MISVMSYQYPTTLPPNGPEAAMSQAGYAPNYGAPAPGPPLMVPRSHEQSLKERKDSSSQASLTLKRCMSTPNVRPRQASASDPNQAALAADKKRNKLGYHRTSVACAPSRASTGPKAVSASSSPAMAAGQSPDMSQFQQYQHVAMSSAQNMAPPTMRPSNIEASKAQHALRTGEVIDKEKLVPSGPASISRSFDFPNQAISNWIPPDGSSSSAKPSNLNETWRSYSQESPMTSSFSPYTPQGPGSAGWGTAINADPNAREEMGWASFVPPGSVPFPSEAQLSSQYVAMPQGRSFGRKSSTMSMDMYPGHITTSVSGLEPHGASLSAGAVPPSGFGSWEQPYTYTKMNEGWGYEEPRDN